MTGWPASVDAAQKISKKETRLVLSEGVVKKQNIFIWLFLTGNQFPV